MHYIKLKDMTIDEIVDRITELEDKIENLEIENWKLQDQLDEKNWLLI